MRLTLLIFISFFFSLISFSNSITGQVIDKESRYGIEYAKISIESSDTSFYYYTDEEGRFKISDLKPNIYNLTIKGLGYSIKTIFEIKVTPSKPIQLTVELDPTTIELDTISLKGPEDSKFQSEIPDESPVSLRKIGSEEIERNPGGNRDISQVIRNLPGVAYTPSFRNDIIIRGGAPNENRFFIDGIEVPNINHFATQGASGGPAGLINVNFVKNVDFYSGAFPANRGNALSSVISFDFKDGRSDTLGFRATIGATDFGLTAEGPLGKKTTLIASVRRSYLQALFKLIKLPFLPTYNDYQYKIKIKPNDESEITIIGLGALDQFTLNESVNDGETDKDVLRRNQYIIDNLPINEQWNYTQGIKYVKYRPSSAQTYVLSRNMLNNESYKYQDNDRSNQKLLDYKSQEIENKMRYEHLLYNDFADITYTANVEYAKFNVNTSAFRNINGTAQNFNYSSDLKLLKYGGSVQANKTFLKRKLISSLGVRLDGNSFNNIMSNPLRQLSPRISLSYKVNNKLSINGNIGLYYQLPNYTSLGFKDSNNEFANKSLQYIQVLHYVAGVRYLNKYNGSFSVEGFVKNYDSYPFLVNRQISLANLGSDFGVIGNEEVTSTSKGQTLGAEFLYQQKLIKGFFGIIAYTYVKSSFSDATGELKPSAWDSRNIVSMSFGKKFKRNWQVGTKFSYSGGLPYTPYDIETSALKQNWDVFNQGQFDDSKLNSQRLKPFHALDIRVDKEYFFKRWSINIYLDLQNIYSFAADQVPILDVERDDTGTPVIANPEASEEDQFYNTELLQTGSGNVLPTIGIIIDF